MKRKILLSLTTALILGALNVAHAVPVGTGTVLFGEVPAHDLAKNNPKCNGLPDDTTFFTSMWLDPGMIIATGLDYLATKSQDERTIDCQDALDELEESLGGGCSGSGSSGTDTSLTAQDSEVVAPTVITEVLNLTVKEKEDLFDSVRYAVESFLFYSDDCKDDCILERQNTWLLSSVAMAAASGDKILASTRASGGKDPMSSEFAALASDFDGQTSPKGMWGSSSKITLHTHVQQNDINALYARDLEMNGLKGVHDAEDVRLIQNDSRY